MASDWIQQADELVAETLAPSAAEVDRSGRIPQGHFDELRRRGFYGFPLGQSGLATADVILDTAATVISGCLATGFVWAQHIGALRALATTTNGKLRDKFLPQLMAGQYTCGVSYAGAQSPPTLFIEQRENDYLLSGSAPLVTGWQYVDAIVAAAARKDDHTKIVSVLVPIDRSSHIAATPLPLIAANASSTVRLEFDQHSVPLENIVGETTKSTFQSERQLTNDWINGALGLGVFRGIVREMESNDLDSAAAFRSEFDSLREQYTAEREDLAAVHQLRAVISKVSVDAAAALVVGTGSRAVVASAPAERFMREATFALVATSRDPIKNALLENLTPS